MPTIRRIQQITGSHCGPAVACMLLDAIGIQVDQETVTNAANAKETIAENGTRVEQLALAVSRISPEVTFWHKHQATLDDIRYILSRGFGVGVEWQGLFYDSEEEEFEEGDDETDVGHYSIISEIDEHRQGLMIDQREIARNPVPQAEVEEFRRGISTIDPWLLLRRFTI